jgi:glucans biosynthesis protein
LNYDQYRSIRYVPERSLWRGAPGLFEAQFFHLGLFYQDPIAVQVLATPDAMDSRPFEFKPELFAYGQIKAPRPDSQLGFAGFRLHAPLNKDAYRDEVIVFQGASYLRALAKGQAYGLSARGLAIDTGEPTPEEFPRFSEFFLVRPGERDRFVWVLALLESRRASGAYAFRIEPGTTTVVDVQLRVFLREPVAILGIAPMSSMYLFGEESPARLSDFRPEVHDSDSLSLHASNGERIHRPLRNPDRTTLCSYRLESPRGFGLLQRDRRFDSYQDLEARYQDRPSAFVEPIGDWGPGSVRLLEIATRVETDDNIAVAWVPDAVPADGLSLRYRLHFGADLPGQVPGGRVVATRMHREKDGMRFLVDFTTDRELDLGSLALLTNVTGGKVIEQHIESNSHVGGYRASFAVESASGATDVELRAFLRAGADAITETWSYLWQPKQ